MTRKRQSGLGDCVFEVVGILAEKNVRYYDLTSGNWAFDRDVSNPYQIRVLANSFDATVEKRLLLILKELEWHHGVLPSSKAQQRIRRPPGSGIRWLADFLFSRKTNTQVVEPMIADMQFEYFEALSQHRRIKAAWIRVRYLFSFCIALGVVHFSKVVWEAWRKV